MSNIALTYAEYTKLSVSSGTVQNISVGAPVELTTTRNTPNSGIILYPRQKYQFSSATLYAKSAWDTNQLVEIRVVPVISGGGGGGGGGGGNTADDADVEDMLEDVFG